MSSGYGLTIPEELESVLHLRNSHLYLTARPWLDLYGVRVRPVTPFGSISSKPFVDLALLHRCLPDELLLEVFVRMTPYDLGRASCVCRKWRYTIRNPVFWRNACLKAWQLSGVVENYMISQSRFGGSWRKMWLLRPRIRVDGIYVSRNTYLLAGVAEWKITNPVHLACYFRYVRFYPSGRFIYKISAQKVKDIAKCMKVREADVDRVFSGHYTLSDDKIDAVHLYPGRNHTVWRIRLRLRGTIEGANNRMDIVSLMTDETHMPHVPAVCHSRGLAPFVFVPFEEVETSVLNLPVEKMDYFIPG